MTSIQFRRRLIVILLLCVAVAGGLIRHFSSPGSTRHDVATVMMLLWLPVIGQVVGWVFRQLRMRRAPASAPDSAQPGFAAQGAPAPFSPHLRVELTLRRAAVPAQDLPLAAGLYTCAFVVGHQGFSVRWQVPTGETVQRGVPMQVQVECLKPALALPSLGANVAFRMLEGEAFVGDGRVLHAV